MMKQDFRVKIGLFGKTNVGKSSLLNSLTNQEMSIVSDCAGTTTDTVSKAMELLPLGPVKIIDTPGVDDISELGEKRIEVALRTLNDVNLVLLVFSPEKIENLSYEFKIIEKAKEKGLYVIGVLNKSDLIGDSTSIINELSSKLEIPIIPVSCKTGEGLIALKREIVKHSPKTVFDQSLISDLISGGDAVVFVVPELNYPKGRLPLCYVRAMREVIDCDAYCIVTTPSKLLSSPVLKMVVLDPLLSVEDIEKCLNFYKSKFTSFAVLEARKYLEVFVKNTKLAREKGVKIIENTTDEREKRIIETLKKEIAKAGIGEGEIQVIPESFEPKDPKKSTTAGLLLLELRGYLDKLLDPFPLVKMGFHDFIDVDNSFVELNIWKW